MIYQSLTAFHQLFSWTSAGLSKCLMNKMIGSQGQLTVWAVPRVKCVLAKNSFTEHFWKWINFQITHCKEFHYPLSKISLHCQTVIYQSLTVFHQLFWRTSAGLTKCPMNKMIVPQSYLAISAVPWLPCVLAENPFTEKFFKLGIGKNFIVLYVKLACIV